MLIPLVGSHAKTHSPVLDPQECINWMVELSSSPDPNKAFTSSLIPIEGNERYFYTGSPYKVRAMIRYKDFIFGVTGNSVWKRTTDNVVTTIGTITGEIDLPVSMSSNTSDIIITNYTTGGWYIHLSDFSFASLPVGGSASGYPGLRNVVDLGGYFIGLNISATPGSQNQVYHSALQDITTWNSLSFGTAIGGGTLTQALIRNNKFVYVICEETTERLSLAGTTPFSFSFDTGMMWEKGTIAPLSVSSVDNTIYMIGNSKSGMAGVVKLGSTMEVVSTPAITDILTSWGDLTSAVGNAFSTSGHEYYVLTNPNTSETLVYDASTTLWHKRKSYNDTRWFPSCFLGYQNLTLAGHYSDGWVHKVSNKIYADNGNPFIRSRTTPIYVEPKNKQIFLNSIEVLFNPGDALSSPSIGSNPYFELEVSQDQGRTWSSVGQVAMGSIGNYNNRVLWKKLGHSNKWTFRITASDAINVSLLGLDAIYLTGSK